MHKFLISKVTNKPIPPLISPVLTLSQCNICKKECQNKHNKETHMKAKHVCIINYFSLIYFYICIFYVF